MKQLITAETRTIFIVLEHEQYQFRNQQPERKQNDIQS